MTNQQRKLKRLTLKQWYNVASKADNRYTNEVLGGKPSRSLVEKKNPDRNGINVMEWAAMLFMVVLMAFAGTKVWPTASAYASTFWTGESVANLPALAADFFTWSTIFVLALMNTIGFVFFKLQTEDEEILAKQAKYPVKWNKVNIPLFDVDVNLPVNIWEINVWSPRMYEFLTYLVLIWQIAIAVTGIHHYNSPIEWLNALLPVGAEIAMATLVTTVLRKIRNRSIEIDKILSAQSADYVVNFDKRHSDERYKNIVFQEMREKLTNMRYLGFLWKENDWLEMASDDAMLAVTESEYKRLHLVGIRFAKNVFAMERETETVLEEIKAENADVEKLHDGKRRPPDGMKEWTVDAMINAFRAMNLSPDTEYNEAAMKRDFASGYGAVPAWRGDAGKQGARVYFVSNR